MATTVDTKIQTRATTPHPRRIRTIGEFAQFLGRLDATNCGAHEAIGKYMIEAAMALPIEKRVSFCGDILEAYSLMMSQADCEVLDGQRCSEAWF